MLKRALITGAGGLIGSESCKFFLDRGFRVYGIDNNMRRYFFGARGDTTGNISWLEQEYKKRFKHYNFDLRERQRVLEFFCEASPFDLVIHTAAQPSHDWASKEPFVDFDINAGATLNLLEATRVHSPEAVFIFTSTNKVYGDNPNQIPLKEKETRLGYDLEAEFPKPELREGVSKKGINERLSLDRCIHSLFGVHKVAADLMVQEYGINPSLGCIRTGVFRGGCLTGPQHSSVELHGYLHYIIQCAKEGRPYTIFGYKGKQVRDQIHSADVVSAFWNFFQNPRAGEVYNLGGGEENSISILETIRLLRKEFGLRLKWVYSPQNRIGDHMCYYTDMTKFKTHFPNWRITRDLSSIVREIIEGITK